MSGLEGNCETRSTVTPVSIVVSLQIIVGDLRNTDTHPKSNPCSSGTDDIEAEVGLDYQPLDQ
jgi:hypothetical protein